MNTIGALKIVAASHLHPRNVHILAKVSKDFKDIEHIASPIINKLKDVLANFVHEDYQFQISTFPLDSFQRKMSYSASVIFVPNKETLTDTTPCVKIVFGLVKENNQLTLPSVSLSMDGNISCAWKGKTCSSRMTPLWITDSAWDDKMQAYKLFLYLLAIYQNGFVLTQDTRSTVMHEIMHDIDILCNNPLFKIDTFYADLQKIIKTTPLKCKTKQDYLDRVNLCFNDVILFSTFAVKPYQKK